MKTTEKREKKRQEFACDRKWCLLGCLCHTVHRFCSFYYFTVYLWNIQNIAAHKQLVEFGMGLFFISLSSFCTRGKEWNWDSYPVIRVALNVFSAFIIWPFQGNSVLGVAGVGSYVIFLTENLCVQRQLDPAPVSVDKEEKSWEERGVCTAMMLRAGRKFQKWN